MIASLRGLLALALITAALVVLAILDRPPAPVDRALTSVDPAQITELIWQRDHELRATRHDNTWRIGTVPADPSAINEVLSALRGARWHRRGEGRATHASLTLVTPTGRHTLGIGDDLPGAEQTWLTANGHAVLVDRWVARALDRDELSLRIRRPLADIERASHVTLGTIRLLNQPWRREATPLLLAPHIITPLLSALRDVEIVRLPDSKPGGATLSITADATSVALAGSCPGASALIAITTTTGDGCITQPAARAITDALTALAQPDPAVIEPRLAPFEPTQLTLPDGAILDVTRLRLADAPADPARVAELVAALSAPGTPTPRPSQPPTQSLTITTAHGTITLELFATGIVARRGEPLALRPSPGVFALLTRPSRALRDPSPWLEEPTTITTIRIDNRIYQRGNTLGTWTRDNSPASAAALDALAETLATPRVLAVLDTPIAPTHRITLTVTPPVGAPTHHDLDIGPPRANGCPARTSTATLLLPEALCRQVYALSR